MEAPLLVMHNNVSGSIGFPLRPRNRAIESARSTNAKNFEAPSRRVRWRVGFTDRTDTERRSAQLGGPPVFRRTLLYFKSEPSGEGWPTRAGERPAPWTLPQNLIDEARALADGRIPLPEPERVPWDVLIAQAVNWDIPERLAA
jgi:hypothetical protein